MGTTPPRAAGPAGPGQGPGQAGESQPQAIPVAFTGRTSTLLLQDPVASMRRQVRECEAKLPPGMFIAAYYWDIESGGLDIAARGHGTAHEQFMDQIGIPRDGGLADLLKEAGSPAPRFAAVICEDIERSGRDTYYALKLEKELTNAGIPLFATDEPIDIAGANATTVLVRRVKQGVAEWFRLQIKEKSWRGLREHSLAGWNIGPAAYGYLPDRVPHPVPVKASQGRTKTRLILDPERAETVERIFSWRTTDKLGIRTIAKRLNANPQRYPPPGQQPGWNDQTVYALLGNPKYTGYMVYGRRRKINGKFKSMPPAEWIWSPEPTHPAIISRATWDAAQAMGPEHSSSRDDLEPNTHPATRRTYLFRSRIRCRDCRRRMSGYSPRPSATYYVCPHTTSNPGHLRAYPDHPPRVSVREDHLLAIVQQFCETHLFGPQRAGYLDAQLPATAAGQAAKRDKKTAHLRKRLAQIDAAEDAHAREIEALAHLGDPNAPAVVALRSRTLARFTELEADRAAINTQLEALTREDDAPQQDPGLLDALPLLTAGALADAPPRLLAQLYQALDLQFLYNKQDNQVTIRAILTDTTPGDLATLITTLRDDNPATGTPAPATDSSQPQAHGQPGREVSAQRPITYQTLHHHGPRR